jgi:outer membrane protein insertion porin family
METEGFRGAIFFDAGTVWGNVNTTIPGFAQVALNEKFSTAKIRTSYGVGIEWMSPIGLLSLAWGFPIHKVRGDLIRNFEFTVGTGF